MVENLRRRKAVEYESEQRGYLDSILGKWVYTFVGSQVVFLKHEIENGASQRHITQIVISGDHLLDGVFKISSYHLKPVFDYRMHDTKLRMEIKKYEPIFGSESKNEVVNMPELVLHLLISNYATDDEIKFTLKAIELYRKFKKRPNIQEIILDIPVH